MCSLRRGLNLGLRHRSALTAGAGAGAPFRCAGPSGATPTATAVSAELERRARAGGKAASHSNVVSSPHQKTRLGFRLAQRSDSPC